MTQKTNEVIKKFYNSNILPPKVKYCSKNPSKVQESPLDARSPQEVLQHHGMYKDESIYTKHPEKIYMDLSEFGDYESNLNANRRMQEKFNALDVDVRARFNHSVQEFTKYVTSNDFDINNVLTKKEQEKLAVYKEEQANKKKYEDYLKSDEYKQTIQESAMRAQYEKQKYEEWKSKNFPSK